MINIFSGAAPSRKIKKIKHAFFSMLLVLVLAVSAVFVLSGCNTPDDPPKTNNISADGYDITHVSDLDKSDFPGNEKIRSWIAERDNYSLDRAYVLSYIGQKDGKPYYSFLVYRKNTATKTDAAFDITEHPDQSLMVLNLNLSSTDEKSRGYELTYVGIKNEIETSLEVFLDGKDIDQMLTVTSVDISPDTWK